MYRLRMVQSMKNIRLRICAAALLPCFIAGTAALPVSAASNAFLQGTQNAESQPIVFDTAVDYDSYILKYTDEAESTVPEIKLNVADCTHDGSLKFIAIIRGKTATVFIQAKRDLQSGDLRFRFRGCILSMLYIIPFQAKALLLPAKFRSMARFHLNRQEACVLNACGRMKKILTGIR